MTEETTNRARFRSMQESTAEDWVGIMGPASLSQQTFPQRVLEQMGQLRGDSAGFAVDRLEHSLQTATRAHRDGRDDEYVVCALLHDIGDLLCPSNHADMAAAMLKPYVSKENHWMVAHHTIFQGYYYFHHLGMDRDMREMYRGHSYFEHTAQFCHLYDQNSLDPDYDTLPLEAFKPAVMRVLERPKRDFCLPEDGFVANGPAIRLWRLLTGKRF
jgi:predicted HD phosphohydrolase